MIEVWVDDEPSLVELIRRGDWRLDKWVDFLRDAREELLAAGETPESIREALAVVHEMQEEEEKKILQSLPPEPVPYSKIPAWRGYRPLTHRKQPSAFGLPRFGSSVKNLMDQDSSNWRYK